MIKSLLKLTVIFVIGVLIYYKFFSTDPAEKAQADRVFSIAKDLGKEMVGILGNEVQRERENGTYSSAVGRAGETIDNLRKSDVGDQFSAKLDELERKKRELEQGLEQTKAARTAAGDAENQKKISNLAEEISKVAGEMEAAHNKKN